MSDPYDTDWTYPGHLKLKVAVVYLTNYMKKTDQAVCARARALLGGHGINLQVWPPNAQRAPRNTIIWNKDRMVEPKDHTPLRKEVDETLKAGGCNLIYPLPVLFCQFVGIAHGLTIFNTPGFNPLILVSQTVNKDKVTLLHEMGHAAGLNHDKSSKNPKNWNFMHQAEPRTEMYRFQGDKFGKARFATG